MLRKRCRAKISTRWWTAWKASCGSWGNKFFPGRRRLIRIAKARKNLANIAIIAPRAALTSGRTNGAYCGRQKRTRKHETKFDHTGFGRAGVCHRLQCRADEQPGGQKQFNQLKLNHEISTPTHRGRM